MTRGAAAFGNEQLEKQVKPFCFAATLRTPDEARWHVPLKRCDIYDRRGVGIRAS